MLAELVVAFAPDARPPPRRALLEHGRLAAVRACRRETSLDRIAEAAARACAAPLAAVSLVGQTSVEFGGGYGALPEQCGRRFSPCDVVVSSEAPLVVQDASLMPEFCDHALVRSGLLLAYAGVPLIDADGYVVGTICAMSPQPGALDSAPLDDLAALACFSESLLSAAVEPPRVARQGWLGVKTKRAHRDGSDRPGAIVLRIARQSPAERAGLKPADILHSLDHYVVRGPDDIAAALAGRAPGESTVVRFQRRGEWLSCRVVLAQTAGPGLPSV